MAARLCATADWPRRGIDLDGSGLPLALALPYLPEREDGRPWLLHGEIALTAQVRPVGNGWRGSAHVTSAEGGMKNSERARRDLVAYDHLVLDATFDPQRLDAKLGAVAQRRRPHRRACRHRLGRVRAACRARSHWTPMN